MHYVSLEVKVLYSISSHEKKTKAAKKSAISMLTDENIFISMMEKNIFNRSLCLKVKLIIFEKNLRAKRQYFVASL